MRRLRILLVYSSSKPRHEYSHVQGVATIIDERGIELLTIASFYAALGQGNFRFAGNSLLTPPSEGALAEPQTFRTAAVDPFASPLL
jgi:hypothetical protein